MRLRVVLTAPPEARAPWPVVLYSSRVVFSERPSSGIRQNDRAPRPPPPAQHGLGISLSSCTNS